MNYLQIHKNIASILSGMLHDCKINFPLEIKDNDQHERVLTFSIKICTNNIIPFIINFLSTYIK